MPQMSPMNWLILFSIFMIILVSVMIYVSFHPVKKSNKKLVMKITKKISIKW